jgi:NADH-quinone oxidoreductase subunit F
MEAMQQILLLPDRTEEETFAAYLSRGGYEALRRTLTQLSPQQVIDEIGNAGLRGRGGAGFPTGKKWAIARQVESDLRYLVCNGGEDEPGSIKDRLLMEHRPHLVLEGMILASYAVGAQRAYLYINKTFDKSIQKCETTIGEAQAAGYLGKNILGSGFDLEVRLQTAPTNYVAGEDSAALEVIEGKEPLPRQKPPYPATRGLFGKPTVVNNVETLANVPPIISRGANWYRSLGTAESPGTMIFSLGEEVNRPGGYELAFGTPLRHLIYECGGGLRRNKPLKAILPGGPSTAFLTADRIDLPLDHKSLIEAGSAIGCGVVSLIDTGSCLVEKTLDIAQFFARESCGQCPACRMETSMLAALLEKVQKGTGNAAMLDQFAKVLDFNKGKGYCALISMPGPPILSALKLFPEDFAYHLEHGTCPATL